MPRRVRLNMESSPPRPESFRLPANFANFPRASAGFGGATRPMQPNQRPETPRSAGSLNPFTNHAKREQSLHRIYFAFGSNLSFSQMTERCPESQYLGLAILADYRWQINERGYANVVQSEGDTVEGLCYLITADDEKTLDLREGVKLPDPSGKGYCYEKHELKVDLIMLNGGRREATALVYLSPQFTKDSAPKQSYCARMRTGVKDALMQGMSLKFVRNVMSPAMGVDLLRE